MPDLIDRLSNPPEPAPWPKFRVTIRFQYGYNSELELSNEVSAPDAEQAVGQHLWACHQAHGERYQSRELIECVQLP